MDDFSAGGVGVLSVHAKGDPARHVVEGDGGELLVGRRGVEEVESHVVSVADPNFSLVRGEADSMAGIAVATNGTFVPSQDFDACEFLSALQIAYFKSKEFVDGHKHAGLLAVDGEGANAGAKGADFSIDGVFAGVGYV